MKLFAAARDLAGADELTVDLPDGSTAGDVRKAIIRAAPRLAPLAAVSLLAVNAKYAECEKPIAAEDEVALIPPVSGG